ncbi:MAG: beta-mannosidase [Bacteroidetes bacterium]|nr:MAG: beta-mannosidase [Bacteroidota bacterium]
MRALVFILLFLLPLRASLQTQRIPLNDKWNFRKKTDAIGLPAQVPGTVHQDLLKNFKIRDPFYGTNEKNAQWIENTDWEYKHVFSFDLKRSGEDHVELVFEGLDTYANVYLNDTLILQADNMFRSWRVDIKKQLKQGTNEIRVVFESAVRKGKEAAQKLPYTLPGDEKIFTRKAQYQYGWDWGPRLVTCGIWKPVYIETWRSGRLSDLHLDYTVRGQKVTGTFTAQLEGAGPGSYEMIVADGMTGNTIGRSELNIKNNINVPVQLRTAIVIDSVRPWWCSGYGAQEIYRFRIFIRANGKEIARKDYQTGFRELKLVREKDQQGESFYFLLNGVPVFAKGANWIPGDNFLPRMTAEKYRSLLTEAKASNMNMLRVWGGGVYEQVIRLRSHPCIALWCGNNEIDEGWHNWGWQKQYKYSATDSARIWNDYQLLFEKTLRPIVEENTGAAYWPSSPSIGWGRSESLRRGDAHYWGVWWGMEPFSAYEKKVGRFMSEYGFQGMPAMSTIRKFAEEKDFDLQSAVMKQHQKHPAGYQTIQTYLERDYKKPKDFESYVYISQLLQAEGMRKAIDAHRRARPWCMGTLYWQFNDCWPVTSWSGIDYYGNRKALQYAVKKAYAPVAVSMQAEKDSLVFYICNDSREPSGKVLFSVLALQSSGTGEQKDNRGKKLTLAAGSVTRYAIHRSELFSEKDTAGITIVTALNNESRLIYSGTHFLVAPKNLDLQAPQLHWKISEENGRTFLNISSSNLAKNVFLEVPREHVLFSDNFFDIAPSGNIRVEITGGLSAPALLKNLRVRTLYDTYTH